jgi:adenine-specific DNA-methyltransferase
MSATLQHQLPLPSVRPAVSDESVTKVVPLPARTAVYPELRYMGSKKRLLPWIHEVLSKLDFESAYDPFSGTGCVGYLMKSMDRRVVASDFLHFPTLVARATIENSTRHLEGKMLARLLSPAESRKTFIHDTYKGIFYTPADLEYLDRLSAAVTKLEHPQHQALAYAAMFRSCLKRQPRGVFTVSGDLARYDDGRRDLKLSIRDHFEEQVAVFNGAVFANSRRNRSVHGDVFDLAVPKVDLVYLDPPYVPRSDDNCYIKRYHFLEGLSTYWQDMPVDMSTKVRKIAKRFTPFSYRKNAVDAFDRMFARFAKSTIVLSYSSNGFPDLETLTTLLARHKRTVRVFEKQHRYHFGTHDCVERASVTEYLIVGR